MVCVCMHACVITRPIPKQWRSFEVHSSTGSKRQGQRDVPATTNNITNVGIHTRVHPQPSTPPKPQTRREYSYHRHSHRRRSYRPRTPAHHPPATPTTTCSLSSADPRIFLPHPFRHCGISPLRAYVPTCSRVQDSQKRAPHVQHDATNSDESSKHDGHSLDPSILV